MSDMASAIVPKSDQLNADDLIAGPITITVTGVSVRGGQEQPVSISFDGDNGKPYKPCKSMCRVMVNAWGPDSKNYVGRSMTLYRDASVKWGGLDVGGIRISHLSDIDGPMTMALTATRSSRKPFTVKPLAAAEPPHPLTAVLKAISEMADKPSRDAAKALASRLQADEDIDVAKQAYTARVAELRGPAQEGA